MEARNGSDSSSDYIIYGSSVVSDTGTSLNCPEELSGPSTRRPRERSALHGHPRINNVLAKVKSAPRRKAHGSPPDGASLSTLKALGAKGVDFSKGNFVIIRPKTSSAQTMLNESIKKLPEEEAICRFCNNTFKGENAVMLTCKCNMNTLAHESCSDQNNKNCDGCEQELQKLLVTLHLEPYFTHSRKHKNKKGSLVSRLLRCVSSGKGNVDNS